MNSNTENKKGKNIEIDTIVNSNIEKDGFEAEFIDNNRKKDDVELENIDILSKFLKYIHIPTNSSSKTGTTPSTEKQWNLARELVKELKDLGLDEIYLDEKYCYTYAILKGEKGLPKIGFIAHIDTSEAVTDENINPQIIKQYDGRSVKLNDTKVLDVNTYPKLKDAKGKTLITTNGETLLGADDKAGIAEIMTMLEYIVKNKIRHGDIYIAFTPDEEIGEGTNHFDLSKFKADFAYTVDGSDLGEISYENFNGASAKININGVSVHLGNAKNVLVNSQLIANELINLIPHELPETTEGTEGYYHLDSIEGNVVKTKLNFLIRDFEKEGFEKRKQVLYKIVQSLNKKYNNCITIEILDQYHNMKDIILKNMHIIEIAKQAMKNIGIEPITPKVRGGTDGDNLSERGLPCPNIGTGGHNFHGIYEYICLEDMIQTVKILVQIIKLA